MAGGNLCIPPHAGLSDDPSRRKDPEVTDDGFVEEVPWEPFTE